MISCPVCGTANREGSRFCNECGRRMAGSTKCPQCGESNPASSRFCDACGVPLGETAPLAGPAAPPPSPASDGGPPAALSPDSRPRPEPAESPAPPPTASSGRPAGGPAGEPIRLPTASASPTGFMPSWDLQEERPGETGSVVLLTRPSEVPAGSAELDGDDGGRRESAEERGLAIAASLAEGRPSIPPAGAVGGMLEAGRAFAEVAAEPADEAPPARQRPRKRRRLPLLLALLALLAALAVRFDDRLPAAPAGVGETLPRVVAQVEGLVTPLVESLPGLSDAGGEQTREGGQRP